MTDTTALRPVQPTTPTGPGSHLLGAGGSGRTREDVGAGSSQVRS
jgi:hypothetical protein